MDKLMKFIGELRILNEDNDVTFLFEENESEVNFVPVIQRLHFPTKRKSVVFKIGDEVVLTTLSFDKKEKKFYGLETHKVYGDDMETILLSEYEKRIYFENAEHAMNYIESIKFKSHLRLLQKA